TGLEFRRMLFRSPAFSLFIIDEFFFLRTAVNGFSSSLMTSSEDIISIRFLSTKSGIACSICSGIPKNRHFKSGFLERAKLEPYTVCSGPKSPPEASTATLIIYFHTLCHWHQSE